MAAATAKWLKQPKAKENLWQPRLETIGGFDAIEMASGGESENCRNHRRQ